MSEGGLKELHALHQRLGEVQAALAGGPKQLARRQQTIDKRRAELDAAQHKLKDLKHVASQKNLDLQVLESKITDLRAKLNAASTNQEFDVFRRQIDADTTAKEVLEMEILETLERIDQQQATVKDCEKAVTEAVAEEARVRAEVAAAEPTLLAEQTELQGQLAVAEKIVPARIMDQYRRVVQAHGSDAMAAVVDKTCTSCFTKLSPQNAVEVNTGKFLFCRACGRLLYKP